jgi:hypothetical protein
VPENQEVARERFVWEMAGFLTSVVTTASAFGLTTQQLIGGAEASAELCACRDGALVGHCVLTGESVIRLSTDVGVAGAHRAGTLSTEVRVPAEVRAGRADGSGRGARRWWLEDRVDDVNDAVGSGQVGLSDRRGVADCATDDGDGASIVHRNPQRQRMIH